MGLLLLGEVSTINRPLILLWPVAGVGDFLEKRALLEGLRAQGQSWVSGGGTCQEAHEKDAEDTILVVEPCLI